MRVILVGAKKEPCVRVARYLEKKYLFKLVEMTAPIERFYRSLYYTGKWNRVRWEKTIQIYDALYSVDNDIFAQYVIARLADTKREDLVIPDIRYISELEKVREQGDFIVVRVTGPKPTAPRPGKYLGDAGPGTIILAEYFNKSAVMVDYAISYENLKGMKEVTDYMMQELTRRYK